jgi:hypothetical protein
VTTCASSSRIALARALRVSLPSIVSMKPWLWQKIRRKGSVPQPADARADVASRSETRGIALPQGFAQHLAALLVAIEEHVLLAGEVIEHRHPSDVGGGRDLVHRHMIEAPLDEEARGGIGDALSRGEALAGSTVGWN